MNNRKGKIKILGVIPARYAASRFPGKLLAALAGKTVLEHVYSQARKARSLDEILVATDDERIGKAVQSFGGNVVRTSPHPRTGTERVGEVCRKRAVEIVVNIQGDEPLIRGEMIDQVVGELLAHPVLVVVTLMKEIAEAGELKDPNTVKVVTDRNGFALYFSRAPIPYRITGTERRAFKHIGLYGYRKEFLDRFISLPQGLLERAEGLEQLRVLENGYTIKVLETEWDTIGIDTPADLERARKLLEDSGQ